MAGALPPGAWWEAKPQSSHRNQPPKVCLLTYCIHTAYCVQSANDRQLKSWQHVSPKSVAVHSIAYPVSLNSDSVKSMIHDSPLLYQHVC